MDPKKLHVVHEPVDTHFFTPPGPGFQPYRFLGPRDDFKFLSVFKWETRKGWRVLLSSYFSAFTADDPVTLYILTNAYHSNLKEIEGQLDAFKLQYRQKHPSFEGSFPSLYMLPSGLSSSDLLSVYQSVDALVQPSRGEGWGRPHVEAMACGLPVIATNWSGNTEYMDDSNSFLIDINGLVPVEVNECRMSILNSVAYLGKAKFTYYCITL